MMDHDHGYSAEAQRRLLHKDSLRAGTVCSSAHDSTAETRGALGRSHHLRYHPRRSDFFTLWTVLHRGTDRFIKWRWIKNMGGHQSRRGPVRRATFGGMQTVHVPRSRRSAEREFEH